jgi:hypothetical protein
VARVEAFFATAKRGERQTRGEERRRGVSGESMIASSILIRDHRPPVVFVAVAFFRFEGL